MSGRRPLLRTLAATAVLILGGVGSLLVPAAASATGATGATSAPTVTGPRADGGPTVAPGVQTGPDQLGLLGQSTTVGMGGTWEIHLRVGVRDPATAELRLVAYSRLTTRTDFDTTLRGREPGSVVWRSAYLPMASLPVDSGGGITLTVPVDLNQTGSDLPRFNPAAQSGVFPLQVELYDGASSTVATLNTSLVFAAGTAAQTDFPKLDVALTLAVHAPAVVPRSPDPAVTASPAQVAASSGRVPPATTRALAAEVRVLERHRGVPVDLAVTPETMDALAATGAGTGSSPGLPATARAATSGLAALVGAGDQLLPATWVATSLPALQAAGLGSEIAAQVAAGSASLDGTLRHLPGTSTWVVDGPLDAATLGVLQGLGATHLVVPASDLTALPTALQGTTFAAPTALSTRTGRLTVQAADDGLASHFVSGGDQVLAGEQLLAELAMIQLETPARQRGVAVLPPAGWTPDTAFLDTVLGGLQDDPLLQPVTVDHLFSGVAVKTLGGSPVVRRLVSPRPTVAPLSSAPAILEARSRLAGYQAVVPGSGTAAAELGRRLLLAESSDIDPATRARLTSGILSAIEGVRAGISLPGTTSITLTARKGSLPLTVLSNAPFHAHVQLRLSSDKLIFEPYSPAGGHCTQPSSGTEVCQLVLTTAVNTVKVPVETRTSGVFTLQVTLTSPDGSLLLGSNRDTVRSTAVSGVGVILIILAFLGLAYWWIRNIRHGRRARQLIEPAEAAALDADADRAAADRAARDRATPDRATPDRAHHSPASPVAGPTLSALPDGRLPARPGRAATPTATAVRAAPAPPAEAPPDAGPRDAGPRDAGPRDAGPAGAPASGAASADDDLFAEFFATPAPQYPLRRPPAPADPDPGSRRR